MNKENPYADMIHYNYQGSKNHRKMDQLHRAAQFAPFSALAGYEDAIDEESRIVEEKRILNEDQNALLDQKLQLLIDNIELNPVIIITYFKKDLKKSGGKYEKVTGIISKINEQKILFLQSGIKIPLRDIYDIESEFFHQFEGFW